MRKFVVLNVEMPSEVEKTTTIIQANSYDELDKKIVELIMVKEAELELLREARFEIRDKVQNVYFAVKKLKEE